MTMNAHFSEHCEWTATLIEGLSIVSDSNLLELSTVLTIDALLEKI